MAKKIYQVTVTLEFEHGADRSEWLEQVRKLPVDRVKVTNVQSKLLFQQCHYCGIDRKFGTLGGGIIGEPADECRAAYHAACQRREASNAQSAG